MKTTKRLLSCLLVLAMLFALAIPAFAADNGTITIKDAYKGETYTVYKVFGATYDSTSKATAYYVKTSGDFYNAFAASDAGKAVLTTTTGPETDTLYLSIKDAAAANAVSEFVQEWFNNKDHLAGLDNAGSEVADSNTVSFTGLDYGYYFVTSSVGTTVTLDNSTSSVEITDKNIKTPTPTNPDGKVKHIVVGDKQLSTIDASINDIVDFSVEFTGTNYRDVTPEGATETVKELVYEYKVIDDPKGMTILSDTNHPIVVTVTEPAKEGETPKVNTIQDAVTFSDGVMIVTIPWSNEAKTASTYPNGSIIKVTYSARLDATTATNNVKLENNGVAFYEPKDPETTIYTYGFDLMKVDGEGAMLQGATFTLADEDGKAIALVKDGDTYRVATEAEKTAEGFKSVEITVGQAKIEGLDAGTYELTETKAPSGYNKMAEPATVILTAVPNDEGKIVGTYTVSDSEGVLQDKVVKIENLRGTVLPSTGGIGTTMFYVVGGLLVAAAVVVLVSKKRMGAEQ